MPINTRTYGTVLIQQLSDQPSAVNNDVTRYFIDPKIYNETGKQVKLGEDETIMPTIDQVEACKKFKSEITTIEQFNAAGTYQEIAKQYGIGVTTAHGHKLHLQASSGGQVYQPVAKESSDKIKRMKAEVKTYAEFVQIGSCAKVGQKYGVSKSVANVWSRKLREMEGKKVDTPTLAEVEKFFTDDKPNVLPQSDHDKIMPLDEQEVPLGTSNGQGGSILPDEDLESPESVKCETVPFCYGSYGIDTCLVDHCSSIKLCKIVTNNILLDNNQKLQGLAEPEPPWTPEYAGEELGGPKLEPFSIWTMPSYEEAKKDPKMVKFLDRLLEEVKKEPSDNELIECLKEDVRILKKRAHERADAEIQGMLLELVGVRCDGYKGDGTR